MSFKDIFEKWERGQSPNAMDAWVHAYKKDESDYKSSRNSGLRRRLRSKKPDDVLDIHGLTRDEAWLSLENFFSKAKNSAFEKVLVIHGKGNHSNGDAVLGRIVREFIEKCPYAGESGQEKASAGGSGATWILLKEAAAAAV
ncbi:MAG: Smr/MutS family protein [Spirochaetes bacterium]|nr:Smr/MutS family protein [Spirochaetota bacterium]